MSTEALPGDKQFTISALIVSTEPTPRVVLHFHRKYGLWLQPGGHIERDENPIEALCREVMEETGLDVHAYISHGTKSDEYALSLAVPDFLEEQSIDPHGGQPAHFHLDLQYIVRVPYQTLEPSEGESLQIGWYTLEETHELPMFENTRMLLKRVFEKITV